MSTPPLSSIPPTFSSFPDLGEGPSHNSLIHESSRRHQREKRTKKSEGSKEPHRTGKQTTKRDKTRHHPEFYKDIKRVEDDKRRIPLPEAQSVESIQHVFYSDRKGDQMNLQYGTLHSGDIPKYRPMGGTRFLVLILKASNTISGGRSILGLAAGFIALRGSGKGIQIGPREYVKVRKDPPNDFIHG